MRREDLGTAVGTRPRCSGPSRSDWRGPGEVMRSVSGAEGRGLPQTEGVTSLGPRTLGYPLGGAGKKKLSQGCEDRGPLPTSTETVPIPAGKEQPGIRLLALEPAFGKISHLSADEDTTPKYAGRKSQSATLLGQRWSSNHLAPPKPMSLKTERINSGKTPPQEDREKSPPGRRQDRSPAPTGRPTPGAERRGVSEDGKIMHPSSRSPQNSGGRKSPVQASQATTLQEQTAAARGADRSSSVLGSSEGGFLSRVQADEFASSAPDSAERQNLPVNPPSSLEIAQAMDTKMKKEEVQEEKRHPKGKADDCRRSGFPSEFPGALHAAPSRQDMGP
eukprot:XP_024302299.1 T-complex protein 10A homolog isoform X2 [Homo sapiens]